MKVTQIMQTDCKQVAQLVEHSVLQDIYQASGKRVIPSKLTYPFTYQKILKNRLGKEGTVKASIDELSDHSYQASFFSAQGKNILRYVWKAVDESHVEVVYEETYEANTKTNDLNFRLMSFLYQRGNKKRMRNILRSMADALEKQVA